MIKQAYGWLHKSMSNPKVYEWAHKFISVHRSLWVIKQVYEWSHKLMSLHTSLWMITQVYEWAHKFMNIHRSLWVIKEDYEWSKRLRVSIQVYECPQKSMSVHRSLWIITQGYEWSKRLRMIHADLNQTVRDLQIELRRQRSSQTPPFRERQQSQPNTPTKSCYWTLYTFRQSNQTLLPSLIQQLVGVLPVKPTFQRLMSNLKHD